MDLMAMTNVSGSQIKPHSLQHSMIPFGMLFSGNFQGVADHLDTMS